MADKKNSKEFSRRDFLKTSGAVTGGFIGGSLLGGLVGFNLDTIEEEVISDNNNDTVKADTAMAAEHQDARIFFQREKDFLVLGAMTEAIFPEDDNGPGAIELGVPYFIDKQLAGPWGLNARDYMLGPFVEGETRLVRAKIFELGLRKLNEESIEQHDSDFFDLGENEQITLLESCEAGEIEMDGLNSGEFFQLVRQATIEGVYADPVYGGNKNKEGWRMKEYPGVYTSYRDMMEEDNSLDTEFVVKEPMSLSDAFNS